MEYKKETDAHGAHHIDVGTPTTGGQRTMEQSAFELLRRWMPGSCYCSERIAGNHQIGYETVTQPSDLCTGDGVVTSTRHVTHNALLPSMRKALRVTVECAGVNPLFVGFDHGTPLQFNLKSSLTQLGIDATDVNVTVMPVSRLVAAELTLMPVSSIGVVTLDFIREGCLIGKVFAADPRRSVTTMEYVERFKDAKDIRGRRLSVFRTDGSPMLSQPGTPGISTHRPDIANFVSGNAATRTTTRSPLPGALRGVPGPLSSGAASGIDNHPVGRSVYSSRASMAPGISATEDRHHGAPLPRFGTFRQSSPETLRMVDGRVVAFLEVLHGTVSTGAEVYNLLPTVGEALRTGAPFKDLLALHQTVDHGRSRIATPTTSLIVRTEPMNLRTMYGRVVNSLLPKGLRCLSSNIVEPATSGGDTEPKLRTFVFAGEPTDELTHIPIEFFSSECYREHVPFNLRKTLPVLAEDADVVGKALATAPSTTDSAGRSLPAAMFVCKGSTFAKLRHHDWVVADPVKTVDPDEEDPGAILDKATRYMHLQPEYPILSALSVGDINSDGVLLTRYFPSPILKSLLLSRPVTHRLKLLIFETVSRNFGGFFSQDDRAMLNDLSTFGIRVMQYDRASSTLYEYQRRKGMDCGLMVPLDRRGEFMDATFFGVYGSNLVEGDFESELRRVMEGVLSLRERCNHPLLNPIKPLALVTGGGPGAMEVGNRVAKSLGILSIGMFVDFGALARKPGSNINEQKKNPYVEAYMTYRPEKLVERQSDFNLDFPIFLTGGVGTDFEYALEEVRRKVGTISINPMILFGTSEHFRHKIGERFQENRRSGTIRGSEWLSNVPYIVNNGTGALAVYSRFFNGSLAIGGQGPIHDDGFVLVDDAFIADTPKVVAAAAAKP